VRAEDVVGSRRSTGHYIDQPRAFIVSDTSNAFADMFERATGCVPYDYQVRLAIAQDLPEVLHVPTGLGKSAAIVLAWVWRRRAAGSPELRRQTPRRVVYCLPQGTLTGPLHASIADWLQRIGLADEIGLHRIMGGCDHSEWDSTPERDTILIGTQEQLLPAALNRGHGPCMNWPIHFALLNNNVLWVVDEFPLMGVGATTTAQLQGFRARLGTYGPARTVWMSATPDFALLETIDHRLSSGDASRLQLSAADHSYPALARRLCARKPLSRCDVSLTPTNADSTYASSLARAVGAAHRRGTVTLVVVNRTARAQAIYTELQNSRRRCTDGCDLALLHTQFRPADRRRHEELAFAREIPGGGRIVIATPDIEAGTDISATTLFCELAAWPALVQRFGRCNRTGEQDDARTIWIDIDASDPESNLAAPYSAEDLVASRTALSALDDVGSAALAGVEREPLRAFVHTLRSRDLVELWDTAADLSGHTASVNRFVCGEGGASVQFYWRDFAGNAPRQDFTAPVADELCSTSVEAGRRFLSANARAFERVVTPAGSTWNSTSADALRPGMTLLLKTEAGGALDTIGWTGRSRDLPSVHPGALPHGEAPRKARPESPEPVVSLIDHLREASTAVHILQRAGWPDGIPWSSIELAARWHDVGKSHPVYQRTLFTEEDLIRPNEPARLDAWSHGQTMLWADADERDARMNFRHELSGALAWLARGEHTDEENLVAFLIAAHHGLVRGSIRGHASDESREQSYQRAAESIRHGDQLPPLDMGNGEVAPSTVLNLKLMRMGEGADGRPSWTARVLDLIDEYGPFRLCLLEMLLRTVDRRIHSTGGQPHG
jgi:CRISPR-associated endonuclease/helicase Cas3